MITLRAACDRGRADFGWLRSAHTFSFGEYYDPHYTGFSVLRVINDDRVAPGTGFSTHGHRNMEIISYVLEGQIAHKDSTGQEAILPAGEFQLMSAGRGIRHSEYNPSETEPLHFLQIWIEPDETATEPGYQQTSFAYKQPVQPVVTADGRDGTLKIRQDAALNHVRLTAETVQHPLDPERRYYLHVIRGPLLLNIDPSVAEDASHLVLEEGDGVAVDCETQLTLMAEHQAEALLFDLPGAVR
ncbi:MAG: pirin family protein [Oceanospirillaceae bacterium]|nr:pirin family protein [Oceanospirillaceae bacterium]MBT13242.1 pirin family protein [Oceanospirillaceae bacterium]|tara:strand:+ start:38169 stop:38897 length:729 start_codon:yes stop_codon:yes gene_type:complete